ncbi:MAG: carboxypeptidase T [Flavobacteriaceae bacterium]|jgi:carboxypeptidase T|tara:strand:- start:13 stop:2424 length:2412 start_codon:yes stop_codon:yes gene_type:complete
MKKILITLFVLFFTNSFSNNKELYHRIKIEYSNALEFNTLLNSGICIDHGIHKKNEYFESDFSESEISILTELNFNYSIVINDVSSFYKNRNIPSHKDYVSNTNAKNFSCETDENSSYTTPQNYDIKDGSDFGGFYTYSEMLAELDEMSQLFPNLISTRSDVKDENIFSEPHPHQTYEDRFLQWVKISDNPNTNENEPEVLYTAVHHAREPASLQQLIFYMWYLLENYETDQEIRDIVDNTELYFIPCVNPDGYVYNETDEPQGGGMWRKNRFNTHGVDNNRNYSYIDNNGNEVWNTAGTSNNTGNDTYAGTEPFSESENSAIRYFVENNDFKLALNNHTYSNLLLYPFGYDYNQFTEDNEVFESISGLLVQENGYENILSSELYPAAGDSDDFMYGMLTTENSGTRDKIFAMTPEIGSSFWPAAATIEDLCKEMLFLNLNAARLVNNYATLNEISSYTIEGLSFNSTYELQRLGISEPGDFSVTFVPVSDNISSVESVNNYNQLDLGETVEGSFSITLNSNINVGDDVSYKLVLNNGAFDKEYQITKIFGEYSAIFTDSEGAFSGNWITNSNEWAETNEDYFSASTSITDSPNNNYYNNENSVITINNEIDLSDYSYAEITFKAKWEIQSNFDYVQLEIYSDNSDYWIPQCGIYTQSGGGNHQNAYGEPLYSGNQDAWIEEKISLSDYLGESILIRFKIITNGFGRRDGFYFDDLEINGISNQLNVNNNVNEFTYLYPNPVSNILNINTDLNDFTVEIYSISGQLLITNRNIKTYDFSNYNSGVYILKLIANQSYKVFKILK